MLILIKFLSPHNPFAFLTQGQPPTAYPWLLLTFQATDTIITALNRGLLIFFFLQPQFRLLGLLLGLSRSWVLALIYMLGFLFFAGSPESTISRYSHYSSASPVHPSTSPHHPGCSHCFKELKFYLFNNYPYLFFIPIINYLFINRSLQVWLFTLYYVILW